MFTRLSCISASWGPVRGRPPGDESKVGTHVATAFVVTCGLPTVGARHAIPPRRRPLSSFARSLKTTAPPEKVWSIWSDVSTWSRWNPDVVSMELDGPFAAGTAGPMTTKTAGGHAGV